MTSKWSKRSFGRCAGDEESPTTAEGDDADTERGASTRDITSTALKDIGNEAEDDYFQPIISSETNQKKGVKIAGGSSRDEHFDPTSRTFSSLGTSARSSRSKKQKKAEPSRSSCASNSAGKCILSTVSLLWAMIFFYSMTTQLNDQGSGYWVGFYFIHGLTPLVFLVRLYTTCMEEYTTLCFYAMATALTSWTVVAIVFTCIELSLAEEGVRATGGGGVEGLQEEIFLEIVGEGLALACVFYHCIIAFCCLGKGSGGRR